MQRRKEDVRTILGFRGYGDVCLESDKLGFAGVLGDAGIKKIGKLAFANMQGSSCKRPWISSRG